MEEAPRRQVALYSQYSGHMTSGFKNAVCIAKKAGLVEYPANKQNLRLTAAGLQCVPNVQPPKNNADMLTHLEHALRLKKAPAKACTILAFISDGQEHTLESIAAACDYPSHTSSGFKNVISTMSSLEILDRTVKGVEGSVRLNDVAFPFGRNGEKQ